MNYRIATLLFCLSLAACKKEPPVAFSTQTLYEDEIADCAQLTCPEISINYSEVLGDGEMANAINSHITSFVIETLNIGEEGVPSANSIEEAAKQFIEIYREHKAEFYDMTAEYEAVIDVAPILESETLISLRREIYMFTGGAHGYSGIDYANFDAKSGRLMDSEEIIEDTEGFMALAEEEFRSQFELNANESINSPGFWFEDDQFRLPETLGIDEEWVYLTYNPYDIAPYSEGTIEIKISMEKASKYLSI